MRSTRVVLGASGLLLALWLGCQRNSDLGIDTTSSGAGGAGGSANASSSGSSSGKSSSSRSGSSGSTSSSSGTGGSEPNLPTAFTVVNGINDYPAILLCFLPDSTPWPAGSPGPAGLAFGASGRVDLSTLPVGVALTTWVIAGDLAATSGLTCAQILALAAPSVPDGGSPSDGGAGGGGAGGGVVSDAGAGDAGSGDAGAQDAGARDGGTVNPVIALELASIPPSVLTSERSLLLVPSGCMGGPGHDNASASVGCGAGYTSTTPTATAVLLGMSRISDASTLSLQAVSASPAIQPFDLHLLPAVAEAKEVTIASSILQGAIAPMPPFHSLSVAAYGSLATVQVNTYSPGSTQKTSSTALGAILATSSVTTANIVNGANLTFVAVGAAPGAAAGPFWNPLTFALVNAD